MTFNFVVGIQVSEQLKKQDANKMVSTINHRYILSR